MRSKSLSLSLFETKSPEPDMSSNLSRLSLILLSLAISSPVRAQETGATKVEPTQMGVKDRSVMLSQLNSHTSSGTKPYFDFIESVRLQKEDLSRAQHTRNARSPTTSASNLADGESSASGSKGAGELDLFRRALIREPSIQPTTASTARQDSSTPAGSLKHEPPLTVAVTHTASLDARDKYHISRHPKARSVRSTRPHHSFNSSDLYSVGNINGSSFMIRPFDCRRGDLIDNDCLCTNFCYCRRDQKVQDCRGRVLRFGPKARFASRNPYEVG